MRGSDGTERVPEGKVVVCGGKTAKFFKSRRHRTDTTARLRRRRQSWVWFLVTKESWNERKKKKKKDRNPTVHDCLPLSLSSFFLFLLLWLF
jgi:hypothetical protein